MGLSSVIFQRAIEMNVSREAESLFGSRISRKFKQEIKPPHTHTHNRPEPRKKKQTEFKTSLGCVVMSRASRAI